MQEVSRVIIPAQNVQSLCWQGDELVDWAGGGTRYGLDRINRHSGVLYSHKFDRAVTSPNGQYAIIYEVLGTKGLVLKDGKIHREINRSYYCADSYEYPVVLFDLPDGRTVLAHCPDEYNKLEIEDAETSERLTERSGETADFFQSRLSISSNGKYLMSAGWIWHPLDAVFVYDIEEALADPLFLDAEPGWDFVAAMTAISTAAFTGSDTALFASTDPYEYETEENEENKGNSDDLAEGSKARMEHGQLGHYSLSEKRFVTLAPLTEPLGTLMPVGDYVVGFYEHPKLVKIATGEIVAAWPDLKTGNQASSIIHHLEKMPPMALDAANKRFAVADGEQIKVIQLG